MAKGKYAGVIDNLPRLLGTEPAWQEKVQAVKQAMLDDPRFARYATFIGRMYVEARAEKDHIDELLSDVNLRLEAISQLMADQFEVEGINSVKLDTGQSISIHLEPYASVFDKESFRVWCLANGFERSLQMWPGTMNKLAKDRLLNGEPEPDGVKIFAKAQIRLGMK